VVVSREVSSAFWRKRSPEELVGNRVIAEGAGATGKASNRVPESALKAKKFGSTRSPSGFLISSSRV